tara:strand:+ start:382 stop:618 length:237 start_codon:yes stop_codon:yes gene_type:complete
MNAQLFNSSARIIALNIVYFELYLLASFSKSAQHCSVLSTQVQILVVSNTSTYLNKDFEAFNSFSICLLCGSGFDSLQ